MNDKKAAIFSQEHACSVEKIQSSRRTTCSPTRKRDLLVGARVFRRENTTFLLGYAPSVEKTPSGCRSTLLPARRRHVLAGRRPLRREKPVFSSAVAQEEKMHPSAVQFGLSRGL